jgi:sporulation protein YlmC with PRC-barrel domain
LHVFLEKENNMAEPRAVRYTDIVPAKKTVIGSKVVNAQKEDLGKIEDLVLDAGAGRIAYAVLSFGGFLGMGDKYFAISVERVTVQFVGKARRSEP